MSTNLRRKRNFKKKFVAYILFLGILGCAAFVLHTYLASTKPLFISPIGKLNTDLTTVKNILKKNNIVFSKVILSDYSYLVDIQNNGQVKLSQNKDINRQIASLQRILIQLTIEGKLFKSIDFRFSEPIIFF